MRAANKLLFLSLALACAACGSRSQQPVAASNEVAANGIDVETLPADESAATPTNELENGVDQADDNGASLGND